MNASAHISDPALPGELRFRPPRPEDIAWVKPILLGARRMNCEFCFGNVYGWAERYGTGIARYKGFFLARNGERLYGMPLGTGDLGGALALLREDARRHGVPLTLFGVTSGDIPQLEAARPGAFRYESNRDYADYIYRQEDLAGLAGKKYHQKRNHIARFERGNAWQCEPITPGALDECLEMERQWVARNGGKNPKDLRDEQRALERCFAHYEALELCGVLLRAEGRVVAFTLGEELNEHCFCTHFEKAFIEEPGAYQMVNQCFAASCLGNYEFVNREEDLGDEGLRRAKQSYYPAILLEKYLAVENEK
ncbi:MAG: phosphatidylglycerol lysyltransferase domain-containing protein [Firmicutes bacterium]|nr:phosphatidylglycerol lysyltransferase domain-containing protein [Bacillota bacterium]